MKYRLEKDKILVSLEKGDEIFDSIYTVINETDIKFGWINGIGAAENITLGAYPLKLKDYIKKEFEGELISSILDYCKKKCYFVDFFCTGNFYSTALITVGLNIRLALSACAYATGSMSLC